MSDPEDSIWACIFHAQQNGLVILDGEKRVVGWNSWVAAASGLAEEEALGKPLEELFPRHNLARLGAVISDALETGASRILTHSLNPDLLPLQTRSGAKLIHDVSIQPLGRRPHTRCLVQVNDVTAAVQRERFLRDRQNARYDAVVNSAPDAILTLDIQGRIQLANPAAVRELGYKVQELVGKTFNTLLSDQEPWDNIWRAVLEGEVARRAVQVAVRRKDGSLSYLEVSASRWTANSHVFVTAILRDVNERRAVEEALRGTQRRLDAVLNNATVAIILLDERQRCSYMNAAAETMTGYTLDEAQGRVMHDVVHHTRPDGNHYPVDECPIDRAFPEEHQTQGEEIFVHKDGTFYPVAFTASPIWDEDAKTIGTIVEVRDISAEKLAKEHQRVLINELNHRVKNTLATVQSIAAHTLQHAPTTHAAKDALEHRLMALSRTHDVLTRENWDGAELSEIVRQAVEPYSSAGDRRLHLRGSEVRLPPRKALALAMALQELATNAVKYGALSNGTGQIQITWDIHGTKDPAQLNLEWAETGGPPVQPPKRRGFGSRLIERSLAFDLDGEVRIEFASTGVVCTVKAPLPGTTSSA